jgi:Icc-related predicted phosphoesterase
MKIISLSDTHTKHRQITIPKGDILIYAGDFEIRNRIDLLEMKEWLEEQPHKHIITIFGNHDFTNQADTKWIRDFFGKRINYLCNDSVTINGLKIWGSSYSPLFNDWAWMKPDNDLKEIWDKIPKGTSVVVTHAPCYGILDQVLPRMESVGSRTLKDRIKEVHPKIHIAGHIHESAGRYTDGKTDYFNVSILNSQYQLENPCTIINI